MRITIALLFCFLGLSPLTATTLMPVEELLNRALAKIVAHHKSEYGTYPQGWSDMYRIIDPEAMTRPYGKSIMEVYSFLDEEAGNRYPDGRLLLVTSTPIRISKVRGIQDNSKPQIVEVRYLIYEGDSNIPYSQMIEEKKFQDIMRAHNIEIPIPSPYYPNAEEKQKFLAERLGMTNNQSSTNKLVGEVITNRDEGIRKAVDITPKPTPPTIIETKSTANLTQEPPSNTPLYLILGIFALGGIAYFALRKKK